MNYKPLFGLAAVAFCSHAAAQITFYEADHFRGRTFATSQPVSNFKNAGFNDQASSVVVEHGRWEVCDDAKYRGRCVVLKRGSYDSLSNMGLENRISSVRPAQQDRHYENEPQPVLDTPYEYRRRPHERLSEAPVKSVRAVVGAAEQRCWVERQPVAEPQREYNVPGAVIGGVLGGILGHQIGGGTGKSLATVGGAVGGAAIGANVNSKTSSQYSTHDVRRCEQTAANAQPQYYDVTYEFRGVEHRVQMASPPGRTVTVNDAGEPRTT